MILAAHQPALMPWLPFFYKIQKCDVFISMVNVQFEKNGYQNRAMAWGKWLTKPVKNGNCLIKEKWYANGQDLVDVNASFIIGMAKVLGIDTGKIISDFETEKQGTDRIIEYCHKFGCDQYLTNVAALDKYLDLVKLRTAGIELVPLVFPYKKHVFEALQEWGLEGTIKVLRKDYK